MLNEVQQRIDDSQYDNWEIYFLIGAAFISVSIHTEIRLVTGMLRSLDHMTFQYGISLGEIVIAALQGIIVGMFGWKLFSQGNRFSKHSREPLMGRRWRFLRKLG